MTAPLCCLIDWVGLKTLSNLNVLPLFHLNECCLYPTPSNPLSKRVSLNLDRLTMAVAERHAFHYGLGLRLDQSNGGMRRLLWRETVWKWGAVQLQTVGSLSACMLGKQRTGTLQLKYRTINEHLLINGKEILACSLNRGTSIIGRNAQGW